MKKITLIFLAFCLLLCCGCSSSLPAEEKTTEEKTAETVADSKKDENGLLDVSGIKPVFYNEKWDGKTLKVLSIGNSFARNATKHLYYIAKHEGIEEITLGVLGIGGCSIQSHYDNAMSNAPLYTYYKNTDGTWSETPETTMLQGLLDEDWDVITLTSTPGQEGIPSYYEGCLDGLISYLRKNKTNPDAPIGYHMSWAYPDNSPSSGLSKQGGTNKKMYAMITDTTQNHIMTKYDIDFLLPTGTAIQNTRSTLGEVFFLADGYHLNTAGEYAAGYMFFASLTGKPLTELKFRINAVTDKSRVVIAKAVNAALEKPFETSDIN